MKSKSCARWKEAVNNYKKAQTVPMEEKEKKSLGSSTGLSVERSHGQEDENHPEQETILCDSESQVEVVAH